jgi:hypothetical protein
MEATARRETTLRDEGDYTAGRQPGATHQEPRAPHLVPLGQGEFFELPASDLESSRPQRRNHRRTRPGSGESRSCLSAVVCGLLWRLSARA